MFLCLNVKTDVVKPPTPFCNKGEEEEEEEDREEENIFFENMQEKNCISHV